MPQTPDLSDILTGSGMPPHAANAVEAAIAQASVSGAGIVPSLSVGTDAAAANTAAIQAALTIGGMVTIPGNLGTVLVNATLTIGSNTAIAIGKGTTLKMADNSGRCNIFANSDQINGNTNIAITGGGALDFNYSNQPGAVSDTRLMGIYLCNVDGVRIAGLDLSNCNKYHVLLASCRNFRIQRCTANSALQGADGFHIHGNSSDGLIEDCSGSSGDDFVAINVKDVSNWLNPTNPALHIGPIRNITVRKISGKTVAGKNGNCVAVYSNVPAAGTALTGASWANGIVTLAFSGSVGVVGEFVQVAGVTPSTYNGNFRVLSASAGQLTYAMEKTPGTYTSGGTVAANYTMTGIRITDIKPTTVNGGNVVYLATFPSPGYGGVIDDVVVDDVYSPGNQSHELALYTCIGRGVFSNVRCSRVSGGEVIWGEPGFNHESLAFTNISNDSHFTGSLGGAVKIASPARAMKMTNCRHLLAGSPTTSGWLLTNGTNTSMRYESIEVTNFEAIGRLASTGLAGIELGAAEFPSIAVTNMLVSGMGHAIKDNGTTGDVNITINGLHARDMAAGTSVLKFYGTGARRQVSVQGYMPTSTALGPYTLLSSVGGSGAVTMLMASGAPNYTYTFNWIASDTPAAGSSLYCNGAEIKVDVTKLSRWDGAIVNNTNAAAGTLGTAGLVSCQGTAANSWSLLSDPTKKY